MQISKYVLAAAIFAAGLSPVFAQSEGQEDEDRAKAREELNRKMAELEAQLQSTEEPRPPAAEELPTKSADKTVEAPTAVEMPAVSQPVVSEPVISQPVVAEPIAAEPIELPKPVEAAPTMTLQPDTTTIEMGKPVGTQPGIIHDPAPTIATPTTPTRADLERSRDEMRSKIAELDAQDQAAKRTTTTSSPAPKPVTKPAPTVTTSTPLPTPTLTITPSTPADSWSNPVKPTDDSIARARAEMRNKIAELDAQDKMAKHSTSIPTKTTSAAKPYVAPVTTVSQPAPSQPTINTTTGDSFSSSGQITTTTPAQPSARSEAEAQALKAANDTSAAVQKPTATSLIQAPPPAVSAGKQQRLNELLSRYKTDKITPEQYHAERAQIINEP